MFESGNLKMCAHAYRLYTGGGHTKVDLWGSSLTMVGNPRCACAGLHADPKIGVDACNTVLEVLLFAAAMNLGQSWNTVLTLFGGEKQAPAKAECVN